MTKKEFEKLGKSFLPELLDYVVKGDLIFRIPISHILCGITFDGSSFDKNLFFMEVFVQPLYMPPVKHIVLSLGSRIGGGTHRWDINDNKLTKELSNGIKREALPFLNKIASPSDIPGAVEKWKKDPFASQAIAYSYARIGDIGKATKAFDELIQLFDVKGVFQWQIELVEKAKAFKELLLTKPNEAQQQLDSWEAETTKNLKLEEYR